MKVANSSKVNCRLTLSRQWLLFVLLISSAFCQTNEAGATSATEYQVKAAYLFNLARFVHWPSQVFSSSDSPLYLCIVGKNPFGDNLKPLIQRKVNGHPLVIEFPDTSMTTSHCQILFISRSESYRLDHILKSVKNLPVLTVSDVNGFIDQQGIIEFVIVNETVRLKANLITARKSKLSISAKLLEVCLQVIDIENRK